MDYNKLKQTVTSILYPFTMPIIYNNPFKENDISDWLEFILNPWINELGNRPLNILLSLAKRQKLDEKNE